MKETVLLNSEIVPNTKMTLQSFDEHKTTVIYDHKEFANVQEKLIKKGYDIGYQEGYEAATLKMKTEFEAQIAEALLHIQADLLEFKSVQNTQQNKISENLSGFFKIILEKLFPHVLKKYGMMEVFEFILKTKEILLNYEKVTVYAGANMYEYIQNTMPDLNTIYAIEEKKDMAPYACQLVWPNGGAHTDLEEKHAMLLESIKGMTYDEH